MTDTKRYPAQVFWSDDDDGYIAIAVDLPGCSAFGKTPAAALAELEDAKEAWLQAAQAAGNDIPAPSNFSEPPRYSGKCLLRMPTDLHRDLSKKAESNGTSLNSYCVYLLTKGIAAQVAEEIWATAVSMTDHGHNVRINPRSLSVYFDPHSSGDLMINRTTEAWNFRTLMVPRPARARHE